MKTKFFIILFFIIVLCGNSQAAKYGGAFLENGIGAKALSMGGSFVSLADDGTAPYWNPAGVGMAGGVRFTAMHAFLFDNLANHDYISATLPLPGVNIAISWIRLGIDDIPKYSKLEGIVDERLLNPELRPDGTPEGYFSDSENAYFFSFSKYTKLNAEIDWLDLGLPIEFGIGGNIKYINHKLYDYMGTGTGLDFGAIVRLDMSEMIAYNSLGWLSLGVNMQDLTKTKVTWNTPSGHGDKIRRNFKTGVSYRHPILRLKSDITISADTDTRYGYSRHYGFQFLYNSPIAIEKFIEAKLYKTEVMDIEAAIKEVSEPKAQFALRAGLDDGDFTAGAGIRYRRFLFDYAFVQYELGNTHRLSFQVDFY